MLMVALTVRVTFTILVSRVRSLINVKDILPLLDFSSMVSRLASLVVLVATAATAAAVFVTSFVSIVVMLRFRFGLHVVSDIIKPVAEGATEIVDAIAKLSKEAKDILEVNIPAIVFLHEPFILPFFPILIIIIIEEVLHIFLPVLNAVSDVIKVDVEVNFSVKV